MSEILLTEQAAGLTPSAGKRVVYAHTDGRLHLKDAAGNEYVLMRVGDAIDGTPIGQVTPRAGAFTTLSAANGSVIVGPIDTSAAEERSFAMGETQVYGRWSLTISSTKGGDALSGLEVLGATAAGLAVTGALSASGTASIGAPARTQRKLNIGGAQYTDMVIQSSAASGSAGASTLYFGNDATDSAGTLNFDHATNTLDTYVGVTKITSVSAAGLAVTGTLSATTTLDVGTGNGAIAGATARLNTSNANVNGLLISNWTGSATTQGPRIAFDNSTFGSWAIGSGNGANTFDICATWGTPLLRLNANGDLLAGGAQLSSERLSVQTTNATGAFVKNTSAANTVYVAQNADTTGDNIFHGFYTEASPVLRGSIDYNRGGGATRYNTTSDKDLKTRVGPAPQEKSLEILDGTVLEEYFWNDDETKKHQIGPFAQDLYKTFKGAVSVGGLYEETVPEVTERRLVSAAVEAQPASTTLGENGEPLVAAVEAVEAVYETVVIKPEHTVSKYRPWAVDKTAYTFHLVAGYQAHKAQIADLTRRLEALEAA